MDYHLCLLINAERILKCAPKRLPEIFLLNKLLTHSTVFSPGL